MTRALKTCTVLLVALAATVAPAAATTVSGIIPDGTTWTKASSPYVVSGDVLVPAGATLTIEPGTQVRFDHRTGYGGYYLTAEMVIRGRLVAHGTGSDRISFDSTNPTDYRSNTRWGSLYFDAGGTGSFAEVDLRRATTGVDVRWGSVEIVRSTFDDTWGAIRSSSRVSVRESVIRRAYSYQGGWGPDSSRNGGGIYIDGGSADVHTTRITETGTAITAQGSLRATGNVIANNGTGIWLATHSSGSEISGNSITRNSAGILHQVGGWASPGTIVGNNLVANGDMHGGTMETPTFRPRDWVESNSWNYTPSNVVAEGNWWGTADPAGIEERIWDGRDEPIMLGVVDYAPPLEEPAATAPVIDLDAPKLTVDAAPSGLISTRDVRVEFRTDEPAETRCYLNAPDLSWFYNEECASGHTFDGLADGRYYLTLEARDASGNPSYASREFTVDTVAPDTRVDGVDWPAPGSPRVRFSSPGDAARFECRIDAGAFAECASPYEPEGLAEGVRTLEVRAVDGAGNPDPEPARVALTVDRTAPVIVLTQKPAALTRETSARFDFTTDDAAATVTCAVDGGAAAPCHGELALSGLSHGAHEVVVSATDPAGNASAERHAWTVDTAPPETSIEAAPSGAIAQTAAEARFSSSDEGARFECRFERPGGAAPEFAPCASPLALDALQDGAHTFAVRAVDAAGNADPTPAARSFSVDTAAPETTLTGAPPALTNQPGVRFAFASSESGSSFRCRLDGPSPASETACASPSDLAGLADGEHTFTVTAVDAAGNRDGSPAVHTFVVETQAPAPPQLEVAQAPDGLTASPEVVVTGLAELGADVELYAGATLAGSARAGDDGRWTITAGPLADGTHELTARARDRAGNVSAPSAVRRIEVDTKAPVLTFADAPARETTSREAVFAVSSTEPVARYECALDGGAWSACAVPVRFSGLALGAHELKARAVDRAGNVSEPAVHAWLVQEEVVPAEPPSGVPGAPPTATPTPVPPAPPGVPVPPASPADPPAASAGDRCARLRGAARTRCRQHEKNLARCARTRKPDRAACRRWANAVKRCSPLAGRKRTRCVRRANRLRPR